jgi:hypothetical protein
MSHRIPGVYAYYGRKGARRSKTGVPHDDPEHRLQVGVATYFRFAMPDNYIWTACPAGMRGSLYQGVKAKAAGLNPGWPDLQILFPTAVTRYIELKSPDGRLTPDQRRFHDFCAATGRDIWALCRTVEDVEATCLRWNIPMKMPLTQASRYATG